MTIKYKCQFPGCPVPQAKAGYCDCHYQQKRRGEELRPRVKRNKRRTAALKRLAEEGAVLVEGLRPNVKTKTALPVAQVSTTGELVALVEQLTKASGSADLEITIRFISKQG